MDTRGGWKNRVSIAMVLAMVLGFDPRQAAAISISFSRPERIDVIADMISKLGNLNVVVEPEAAVRRMAFRMNNVDPLDALRALAEANQLEVVPVASRSTPIFLLRRKGSTFDGEGAPTSAPLSGDTSSGAPHATPGGADRAAVPSGPLSPIPLEARLLVGPGAAPTVLWRARPHLSSDVAQTLSETNGMWVPCRQDGVELFALTLDVSARVQSEGKVLVHATAKAQIRLDGTLVEERLTGEGLCSSGTTLLLATHARPPGRLVELEFELYGPVAPSALPPSAPAPSQIPARPSAR